MYHDSPDVQFQHRLVAMVEGEGSVRPFQYLWTTSPTLNDLIPDDALTVPIVKVRHGCCAKRQAPLLTATPARALNWPC